MAAARKIPLKLSRRRNKFGAPAIGPLYMQAFGEAAGMGSCIKEMDMT